MSYPESVARTFWHLLEMSAGVFLLGVLIGLVLFLVLKPAWVERWLGRGHRSALWAALAGAVLPGCALSSVPIAQSLKARGASVGTLTAFLMVAPLLSPHTVALTVAMLGWPFAIWRVVLPIAFTWALGAWLDRRSIPSWPERSAEDPQTCCGGEPICHQDRDPARSKAVTYFYESALPLIPYFLGGLFLVALLEPLLKREWMEMMADSWMAYGVALLVGFPLYVCNGGEVPLTLALMQMGVPPGPAFTFLIGSVGTCFATIAMAPRIIGWNATVIYAASLVVMALVGGVIFAQMAPIP